MKNCRSSFWLVHSEDTGRKQQMQRIGVFVCNCGTNIAATVDVKKVVEMARRVKENNA